MDKRTLLIVLPLVWLVLPEVSGAASSAATSGNPHLSAPVAVRTPAATATPGMATPVPTDSAKIVVPDYQTYNYYGDRYRDPFVALNGEYHTEQGADRPPQISSLLLKGLIQDEKSRMALLTSGVSSYILRGGRLYDGRNHLMKGISGVIKPNSVVLMGSDRTVRELKVNPTL